ncbi:hypothetical protein PO909_004633, partial [Leuciscus waleckii]
SRIYPKPNDLTFTQVGRLPACCQFQVSQWKKNFMFSLLCISAWPPYNCTETSPARKRAKHGEKGQNSPQVVVLLLCREILDCHNPGTSAGKRRCVASVVICSYRYQEQALMQPAAPTKNSTRLTRSLVQSTKLPPPVTSKLLVT